MEHGSRLERLFDLIENGTSAATRQVAAEQVGETYGSHPDNLPTLLSKLVPLLRHANDDTRAAAAAAFGHICRRMSAQDVGGEVDYPTALNDLDLNALMSDPRNTLAKQSSDKQPASKKSKTEGGGAAMQDDARGDMKLSARVRNQQKRLSRSAALDLSAANLTADEVAPVTDWTMQAFVAMLLRACLAPSWEVRHGALLALRHCMSPRLQVALADRCIRVLALERVNDYANERVCSPVREAAAALLGSVMGALTNAQFAQVANLLLFLAQRREWEVRHAGLLGLRDAITMRYDLMRPYVADIWNPLLALLEEEMADDDVIAVTAETLLLVASDVAAHRPDEMARLVRVVWKLMEQLEDLSASLACLLKLLSALYMLPGVARQDANRAGLVERVPLMFPLLRHEVGLVRLATVEALATLVRNVQPGDWALPILPALMTHTLRNFALESSDDVLQGSRALWIVLLSHSPADPKRVCAVALPEIGNWLRLVASPECESMTLAIHGSEALAQLLRMLPSADLPAKFAPLLPMVFASPSCRERLVGSLIFAAFARHNATMMDELAQLLSQRLLQLVACWQDVKLGNAPPRTRTVVCAAVACAWACVASCKGPAAGDWSAALNAMLVGIADAEASMQRLVADSLALLLHSRNTIDAPTMLRLCQLLVADRKPSGSEEEVDEAALLTTRGAVLAFEALSGKFGPRMLVQTEPWWHPLLASLVPADQQLLGDTLRVMCTVVQAAGTSGGATTTNVEEARPLVMALLSLAMEHLETATSDAARAHFAACVAAIARLFPVDALRLLCVTVMPRTLANAALVTLLTSIHAVLVELQVSACPFIAFMVVPVLGAMSSRAEDVRRAAAGAFAQLVGLMALERGVPDPVGFGADLSARRVQERRFIEQLVGGEPPLIDNASLGLVPDLQLRPYQQSGIAWMVFLARYRLHGVMADDMGLGKTVQALCAVSYAHAQAPDRQSLIVCPASVVHHWMHESTSLLSTFRPLSYVGTPSERAAQWARRASYNLIVTSYEVLRSDATRLSGTNFLYCVLDEGHIIRNASTKVTLAVKRIAADHRLVLSGTPLQNEVVELWSLFDFLSPGYLGTERAFRSNYSKPILAARDAKAKPAVRERGTLALEALHRQILPFIMRRTKETVLKDLPPKIIQDYLCDMAPLQALLYEDFASVDAGEEPGLQPSGHVFQTLQHVRKLLNHPAVALAKGASSEEVRKANEWLQQNQQELQSAEHSGKLLALEELLHECGVGGDGSAAHRVLLFCQQASSMDLIERLVFKARMPKVTYMRLDGSVAVADRGPIVTRFNADPTVDVLMLTVKVGGLGLNLTGADTVIFFEHDWNPQVDAQAMDRAHRLGQKRVVNVYRIITRNSLEEKIMSLQRFKLHMARTVVNEQNASMSTMDTGALLDLMEGSATGAAAATSAATAAPLTAANAALAAGVGGGVGGDDDLEELKALQKLLGN